MAALDRRAPQIFASPNHPSMHTAQSASATRILVVDDELGIRSVLRELLELEGYQVDLAASGEEAVASLRTRGADLVLSDLMMPGIDGIEVLRYARTLDETIGFVILTGAGTLHNSVEALRAGADDYILKPFELDVVLHAVARSLAHRRLLHENSRYKAELERQVADQARQIERMFEDALLAVAGAVEARDGYTGAHIERVTRYAVAAGRECALSEEELRALRVAGLLHDVGKVAIPDSILMKAGPLTADEYEVMKRHAEIGASMLERSPFLRPAKPAVLHHHERWDGGGYPLGLRGPEIPIAGRILAVVDTFDAIVTTRPYRAARTFSDAIEELERCSGSQFDPAVVAAFRRALLRSPGEPLVLDERRAFAVA
jgi:response regulator RpfG family c-di-GMP phosphodiesterase